jgi:hypothetical protein
MPEYPHNRHHIFLHGQAGGEVYIARGGGRRHFPPSRNREEHARRLEAQLNQALTSARQLAGVTVRRATEDSPGYYLEFVLSPQGREFIQSLENRQQGIELLSVTPPRYRRGDSRYCFCSVRSGELLPQTD